VYGPWGRPDMALSLFARNILEGRPIQLFNKGGHTRDFTYIDDIVDGVILASDDIAKANSNWDAQNPDPATSDAPFRIFNIGNAEPVKLKDFVAALEDSFSMKAEKELLSLQPGDVPDTFADVSELRDAVGYEPSTSVREGVAAFADWYRSYHQGSLSKSDS